MNAMQIQKEMYDIEDLLGVTANEHERANLNQVWEELYVQLRKAERAEKKTT